MCIAFHSYSSPAFVPSHIFCTIGCYVASRLFPGIVEQLCLTANRCADHFYGQVVVNRDALEIGPVINTADANLKHCTYASTGQLQDRELEIIANLSIAHKQYLAPEVLRGSVTSSSDIWSFGVLAAQLLTGLDLFDTQYDPPSMLERVLPILTDPDAILERTHVSAQVRELCASSDLWQWPDHAIVAVVELIRNCCQVWPSQRASADKLQELLDDVEASGAMTSMMGNDMDPITFNIMRDTVTLLSSGQVRVGVESMCTLI